MANLLSDAKKQQVIALGQLGWTLRGIQAATGVRRETAGSYLKAAGLAVRPAGRWGHPPKPAKAVSTDPANPASEVSTDSEPPSASPAPTPLWRPRPPRLRWASLSQPGVLSQPANACRVHLPEDTRTDFALDAIAVVTSVLPHGGRALFSGCPRCGKPRRYLYGLALVGDRLVEDGVWRCHHYAGLLFRSQGCYRSRLTRAVFTACYGDLRVREPYPRHPWDPRAVWHPRMIVGEFPGVLMERTPRSD
jgi:hypothetical protein